MYVDAGKGAGPAAVGGVILPNTGGNTILTILALTAIVVGTAIVVSSIVRLAAAKAYKA